MNKEYYFISGLPRSGSTLLSAILKQNPNFYADISSPMFDLAQSTIKSLFLSENHTSISEETRRNIVKSMFDGYYHSVDRSIIFDSQRAWTSRTDLIKTLFPYSKIICCTRDILWILDSFERIVTKNCLYNNYLFNEDDMQSVYTRCKSLMDVEKNGKVIKPLLWINEGLAKNSDMIHVIDYDELCKNPKQTMMEIYKFLDKPYFEHDFNDVEYKNDDYDIPLGFKDLHTVRKKVEWVERESILPREIINQYRQAQIGNYS